MKRRDFAKTIAAGTAGAAVGGAILGREKIFGARTATAAPGTRLPVLMKVGCQSRSGTSQENLEFLARHGVYHMNPGTGGSWDYDTIRGHQDDAAKYGITIGAYHLPLTSAGIDRVAVPNIMLGKDPDRDRDIERIQEMITHAGRAGVPRLMYNMTILPVLRTGRTVDPTRGNASYSTWNMEEAYARGMDEEMTVAGEVDIDTLYERITYFLDRALPVAEEYNVKLANHIADPPAPVGYRGITRWNSPEIFAGIRRYAELYESPSHGFNFCIGSTGEGLRDPATEIFPIIEYLGNRNQIVNVHLRNIKGGWGYFEEVYPDNGDMNFVEVMRTLRDVGYDGMVMPDHVPQHPAPGSSDQAFVFAYGYIRALLQMLEMDGG
jgi:mannonate dehydratase